MSIMDMNGNDRSRRHILLLVDAGLTDTEAAQRLGVSRRTFQRRKYKALEERRTEALATLNHPDGLSPREVAIIARLDRLVAKERLSDRKKLNLLHDVLNLDAELTDLFGAVAPESDAVAPGLDAAYAGPTRARRRAPEAGPPNTGGLDGKQDTRPFKPHRPRWPQADQRTSDPI